MRDRSVSHGKYSKHFSSKENKIVDSDIDKSIEKCTVEERMRLQSIRQAQDQLMDLYTGDFKKFKELRCKICNQLPLDAKECANPSCAGQICSNCREDKDKDECECGQSFETLKEPHKFMKMMIEDATFACPYKCKRKDLTLKSFE